MTAKKTRGILLIPTGRARETFTTETGQPRPVYFVPGYDVSVFSVPSVLCPNGVFIRNAELRKLNAFYKAHPIRCHAHVAAQRPT